MVDREPSVSPQGGSTAEHPEVEAVFDLSNTPLEDIKQRVAEEWLPYYDIDVFDADMADPDDPIWVGALKIQREFAELAWRNPNYALEVATEVQAEHRYIGDSLVSDMAPGIMAHDYDAGAEFVGKLFAGNHDGGRNVITAIDREVERGRLPLRRATGILANIARSQFRTNTELRHDNAKLEATNEKLGNLAKRGATYYVENAVQSSIGEGARGQTVIRNTYTGRFDAP